MPRASRRDAPLTSGLLRTVYLLSPAHCGGRRAARLLKPGASAPLERDLAALVPRLSATARVVLLGSIASDKYVDMLAPLLGARLHYPVSFIGRGDMSRGGLLLRSAASGNELEYAWLDPTAPRRGRRPPRLEPTKTTGRGPDRRA